jgi:hypothetical protein
MEKLKEEKNHQGLEYQSSVGTIIRICEISEGPSVCIQV